MAGLALAVGVGDDGCCSVSLSTSAAVTPEARLWVCGEAAADEDVEEVEDVDVVVLALLTGLSLSSWPSSSSFTSISTRTSSTSDVATLSDC